jgi:hypothetical protein
MRKIAIMGALLGVLMSLFVAAAPSAEASIDSGWYSNDCRQASGDDYRVLERIYWQNSNNRVIYLQVAHWDAYGRVVDDADEARYWISYPPNGSWYLFADISGYYYYGPVYTLGYTPRSYSSEPHHWQVRVHYSRDNIWCSSPQIYN